MPLGYEEPPQDDRRQQHCERGSYNSCHSSSPGEVEPLEAYLKRYGGIVILLEGLLGGLWELVTTYNRAYNHTYNPPK